MSKKSAPDLSYEAPLDGRIAGIDEAGRGPWAGPVVAAAVVLDQNNIPDGLNDSKKLSDKKREALYDLIIESADYGIGQASVDEIDAINILNATYLAMNRAVENLGQKPDHCLVDGNRDPKLGISTQIIIKGDQKSLSIAAASILAKVFRDRIMTKLAENYPHYGWERNAGYGVPAHRDALRLVGISPHHRKSFKPIRESLLQDSAPSD